MKKARQCILVLFVLALLPYFSYAQDSLPEGFTDGLKRAKMTFSMPEGFEKIDIIENPHMNYEYAIRDKNKKLEIRYAIRPIDSMLIQHEKSKTNKDTEIVTTPNQIAAIMHIPTAMNISGNMDPNSLKVGPLGPSKEAIQEEFGANDGVVIPLGTLRKEFSEEYTNCMLISMWKEDLGTGMVFFLFNDMKDADTMKTLMQAFYSLRFE